MDDNLCIAPKSYKKPSIGCTRIATDGYFCRYHNKSGYVCTKVKNKLGYRDKNIFAQIYCNKIIASIDIQASKLDSEYSYPLMGLYDSWNNIKYYKRIKINGIWWSIDILINVFIQQLNMSNMNGPSPKFLYNPFTLINFSIDNIKYAMDYIKKNKILIDIALYTFLTYIDNICDDIEKKKDDVSYIISEYLSLIGRFMILNLKDSQGCYIGKWVPNDTPLSSFEDIYCLLKIIPYQTIDYDYRGMPIVIENPERNRIFDILDTLEPGIFNTDNIFLLE